MTKEYHIFISHSWKYPNDLENLRNLLRERGYFNVEFEEASADEPINSANAYYIKKRLTEKITNSNIVLGIAGMYASYSDWMEWELDKAIELGVPIVGVIPRGQERISQTVSSRSEEDVRWNTESIVAAIRRWAI
ncbi:MAG: TIR domain-containing protein [Bacteroidota bacterium]